MKVAEWKRELRSLLPVSERWEFRGSLCYRAPVTRVLVGVLGERSGFDQGVYIWRVVMPLFVPNDVIVLTWSERAGGGSRKYDKHDGEALRKAMSSSIASAPAQDVALRHLVSIGVGSPNRRASEVAAYSQVILGDIDGAEATLNRVAAGAIGPTWEREIVERVQVFHRILEERGRDEAVRRLDTQAEATATALGLVRLARWCAHTKLLSSAIELPLTILPQIHCLSIPRPHSPAIRQVAHLK